MRWPWQRPERRNYEAILTAALEAAAVDRNSAAASAALECAAGFLARELAGATVEGPDWVRRAVTRNFLDWIGRRTVRAGEAVAAIHVGRDGDVMLLPSASHYWHGDGLDERTWDARVTVATPHSTQTRLYSRDALVVSRWTISGFQRHFGIGPTTLASATAATATRTEQRLAEHASSPVASLVPVPEGHSPQKPDDDDADPLAGLRAGITGAKGAALLLETLSGGWGDRSSAPQGDWKAQTLGPHMSEQLNEAARDSFARMVSACGLPPSLFDARAEGTAQREAIRRARLNFVQPFAARLQDELSDQLGATVRLRFDNYALDMVSRAQVVHKLTASGVALTVALAAVGLADAE